MLVRYLIFFLLLVGINSAHATLNNSFEELPLSNTCVGDSGKVEWLIYLDIPSNTLDPLFHEPKFPQSPDQIQILTELASSGNYSNYFGGMVRGIIRAPETGGYVFNITGDDNSVFRMSTDTLKANLADIANVPGWSGNDEYEKYPEQTSDTIQLTANEYYYFEAIYKDGSGGDFVRVHWKKPSTINSTDWEIIPGSSLYMADCQIDCPKKGTTCDDGDATTINDMEDGACHCTGTPQTLPFACIGDRGTASVLFFDTIPTNKLDSLYTNPNYPLSPHRVEVIDRLQSPLPNVVDEYGTRLRAYLRVPETGYYQFNVTGDDVVRLLLSASENATLTDEIAYSPWPIGDWTHTTNASQTSDSIMLQAGDFYALEMHHKQNTGGDDFYIFWKTPFAQDTVWRILDGSFLYSYNCELACIPEGTVCNDGDSNTFDDQYDGNCNCVGTPCADPECSNALDYTPYEECATSTEHSNDATDAWLSCQPTQSPNTARGINHWIMYDFGQPYVLDDANIWNYNVTGSTGQGFQNVEIDVSMDGVTWTTLGNYTLTEAPGTSGYAGFPLELSSSTVTAQYILITSLSNFDGGTCFGMSEITFGADTCPQTGTPCDDGNAETGNDVFDAACNCVGSPLYLNDCMSVDSLVNEIPIVVGDYDVEMTITSSGKVVANSSVNFVAGHSIVLLPGFVAEEGSDFIATIKPCVNNENTSEPVASLNTLNENEVLPSEKRTQEVSDDSELSKFIAAGKAMLTVSPNPASNWANIDFYLPEKTVAQLSIHNASGQLITMVIDQLELTAGMHQKRIPAQQMEAGVYFITLKTANESLVKRLIVISE